MINFKILLKALIPSKETVLVVALVSAIAGMFLVLVSGVVIGLYHVLQTFFGDYVAGIIFVLGWIIPFFYIFVVEPVIDRYKEIKSDMENKG